MILKSYISIHDVSPQNLDDIKNIIDALKCQFNINKICILVIPGLDWKFHQIKKLKALQKNGIEIAAHGWKHEAPMKKSFYHKIHSLIISANCAEHLSKNGQDIIKIVRRSYGWFVRNGFKNPKLYVPPGWALGKVTKEELYQFNFTHFECTTGMVHKQKYSFLPLLGFEENTLFGALLRRFFNSLNFILAHFTGTIRIAIHPNDFNLYLKKDLEKYLTKSIEPVLLHELS